MINLKKAAAVFLAATIIFTISAPVRGMEVEEAPGRQKTAGYSQAEDGMTDPEHELSADDSAYSQQTQSGSAEENPEQSDPAPDMEAESNKEAAAGSQNDETPQVSDGVQAGASDQTADGAGMSSEAEDQGAPLADAEDPAQSTAPASDSGGVSGASMSPALSGSEPGSQTSDTAGTQSSAQTSDGAGTQSSVQTSDGAGTQSASQASDTAGAQSGTPTSDATAAPTPTPTPAAKTDSARANLNATIKDAKSRDLSGYTVKSAALFRAAIKAAESVSADKSAQDSQLSQAEKLLVCTFTALMTKESSESALKKAQSGNYDGTYTVSGRLMHATSAGQSSMGNDALKKPFQVIVTGGKPVLRIEFTALTAKLGSISFTGYLGKLNYFPGYTGSSVPAKETPAACPVASWYELVDDYNDPKTGLDPSMRGKKYPHVVTMPVDFSQSSFYVQVYVSVMESISAGSGTQFAKLEIDWDTMKQISGTDTDRTVLKEKTNLIRSWLTAMSSGKVSKSCTEAEKQLITAAAESGEAAVDDMNITQKEIDATVDALNHICTMFSIRAAADKTKLSAAIAKADKYLVKTSVYTAASLKNLKAARKAGSIVYEEYTSTQEQTDAQTKKINAAIKALKKITANKKKLAAAIKKANARLKKTSLYTKASLAKLKKVKTAANKVYKKSNATQKQVDAQTAKINAAIKALKKKTASKSGSKAKTGSKSGSGSKKNTKTTKSSAKKTTGKKAASSKTTSGSTAAGSGSQNAAGTGQKADFRSLADGEYTITGSMVKIDRQTASMSNDAINHAIKLTVSGGAYAVTIEFRGLQINNMLGYLGKLRYFQSGYTLDGNGSPQGSLAEAAVESYQTDASGNRLKDNLGTDYPKTVTVPLIPEAMQDGFVPLQVFVPIMESISAGTGTQPVFLKLDLNSVTTGFSASSGGTAASAGNSGTSAGTSGTSSGRSSLPGSTASAGSTGSSTGTSSAGAASGGSPLGGSTLEGSLPDEEDLEESSVDAPDADEEDDESEGAGESALSGLGSLDSPDADAGTGGESTYSASSASEAEGSEEETVSDQAGTADEAEETPEPPLRKMAKPMGIGTPVIIAGLILNELRRRKILVPGRLRKKP